MHKEKCKERAGISIQITCYILASVDNLGEDYEISWRVREKTELLHLILTMKIVIAAAMNKMEKVNMIH